MKKRIAVIGAGLCGSALSMLLRNHFKITVIEQGRKKRPLLNDVICKYGDINTSINRAEGLGGTTNYWHNALIELTESDQLHAGIDPCFFADYYAKAWAFFLGNSEKQQCDRIRDINRASVKDASCTVAHMVVPYARANAWVLANTRYPGEDVEIVYGNAEKIVPAQGDRSGYVAVNGVAGAIRVEADYFLVCAGGLATPVLLSRSVGSEDCFCEGYHDHPMAYVAKVQLRPDSVLKSISCTNTPSTDVRSGFLYETNGVKTAFYLRPAIDLSLKSITGTARYILSDLRNDPFSPKKILQLMTNLDALKEAILFKSKAGFRGDYYSVLLLGEQNAIASRGIALKKGKLPELNWHITEDESKAYKTNFERFMADFVSEITAQNCIASTNWEFRTAAHHSGGSRAFVAEPETMELPFFAVKNLPNSFVCDASLLRAGGIANSGLTLVALSHRLAELAIANL